ncbi:MAG: hypothetical protein WD378_01260, partial [Egicoccus sp.]
MITNITTLVRVACTFSRTRAANISLRSTASDAMRMARRLTRGSAHSNATKPARAVTATKVARRREAVKEALLGDVEQAVDGGGQGSAEPADVGTSRQRKGCQAGDGEK